MPPEPLRVAMAEDHYLVREGTRRLLESAGVEVVATVADGEALLEAVEAHRPDAVLTDVRMSPSHGTEGIEAAREIRRRHPDIGVVVLSQHADEGYVIELCATASPGTPTCSRSGSETATSWCARSARRLLVDRWWTRYSWKPWSAAGVSNRPLRFVTSRRVRSTSSARWPRASRTRPPPMPSRSRSRRSSSTRTSSSRSSRSGRSRRSIDVSPPSSRSSASRASDAAAFRVTTVRSSSPWLR